MNREAFRTENLSIGYPQKRRPPRIVADGINVTLHRGEVVCLLGPNGAGKSTLLRTLAGMQAPLSGAVWLDGQPLASYDARALARRLSVVLTERISVGMLSAYGLVALGRYPYTSWTGRLTPADDDVVRQALTAVGAWPLASRYVAELSDGERQKVLIARALAQEPAVMILDEPTAFLDLPHRVEIVRILRDLAHRDGCTILLSTHDLDLALRHADKLWLLDDLGRLRSGAPEDLVLDGAFGATFQGRGLVFDPVTGTFVGDRAPAGQIDLIGAGVAATWTRRALERQGYAVHEGLNGSAARVRVLPEAAETEWLLEMGGAPQRCDSVGELLNALRAEEVP